MKKLLGEKNLKKGGIAEEIAILKQRREARKAKEEKKNLPPNQKEARNIKTKKIKSHIFR